MSLSEILKRTCWSTDRTFKKFYEKGISSNTKNEYSYGAVLMYSATKFKWFYLRTIQQTFLGLQNTLNAGKCGPE